MKLQEAIDEIIYRVIDSTPKGHYVPKGPAAEHFDEIEEKIGREMTVGERARFEDEFKDEARRENDYKEMYEM